MVVTIACFVLEKFKFDFTVTTRNKSYINLLASEISASKSKMTLTWNFKTIKFSCESIVSGPKHVKGRSFGCYNRCDLSNQNEYLAIEVGSSRVLIDF